MRLPSVPELAAAAQLLAAAVMVGHLAAALAAARRQNLTGARVTAVEGIVAGLGIMTAATIVRTLAL
ncbi:MAG: hypothetical protein ACREOF_19365 [Gemmatimonadales bacterium]